MSGGSDEKGVVELRADADASSIAAELRSIDERLGQLFDEYQTKITESFGRKLLMIEAMLDFGADLLETAHRDGSVVAIELIESELAAVPALRSHNLGFSISFKPKQ